MKTQIIYDAKIHTIKGDCDKIFRHDPIDHLETVEGETLSYGDIQAEIIKARQYNRMVNGETQTWIVGFDKELCHLLEILPTGEYEELIRLRDEIYITQEENEDLENKISELKQTGFLKRLRWLFTGVKG